MQIIHYFIFLYGDISVDHVYPSGQTTRVGLIQGVAVYAPTAARRFEILLDRYKGIDYSSGKLQVVYADQSPRKLKLADAELALQ